MTLFVGKGAKPIGVTPSIVLTNPKYPHNLGQVIRAASCFGVKQVWYTGDRVKIDEKERLPREERLKGYAEVDLIQYDYPMEQFQNATPVAIELAPNAEILTQFEHPENPVYLFGPEDGSLSAVFRRYCHRFVTIPTRHCTNLSAAVYLVLYDRLLKRQAQGLEPILPADSVLAEMRGWDAFEDMAALKHRGNLDFVPSTA